MCASSVRNPIFEIDAIEYKTNTSSPMFSVSGKKFLSFGSLAARASPKASVVGFLLIQVQADQEFLSLDHQKGEVNLRHFPKSRQGMLVVSDW